MPAWVDSGLAIVIAFVPKFVLALVILIVGLIVARLVSRALSTLLTRVGFDRLVERGGVAKALANSKLDPSDTIAKIVYSALVLFVLQFAFGVFDPNPVSTLLGMMASSGIIFLGVIAAINQLGIAITVITPVVIAVLTAIVGVIVGGGGGGLIRPMQSRWESYLGRLEAEAPNAKAAADTAPSVTEQAQTAASRARRTTKPAATSTDSTTL